VNELCARRDLGQRRGLAGAGGADAMRRARPTTRSQAGTAKSTARRSSVPRADASAPAGTGALATAALLAPGAAAGDIAESSRSAAGSAGGGAVVVPAALGRSPASALVGAVARKRARRSATSARALEG
jgi:hypothetical protein